MNTEKYSQAIGSIQSMSQTLGENVAEVGKFEPLNEKMNFGKVIVTTVLIVIGLIVLVSIWGVKG